MAQALCAEVTAKMGGVIVETQRIFESHGEVTTLKEDTGLRARFEKFLQDETAAAQAAIHKSDVTGENVTRLSEIELGDLWEKINREFKLMLASLRTAAAKASPPMKISNSNVQIGDNKTQNNQVTVFRDILAKIDASQHTEIEKAAAKYKLSELLAHPVFVSTIGALAGQVFKG